MYSEKAEKTIEACRFCCMCRHLCPLGLALGKELNNPRAKALLLSMVERGSVEEAEIAKDMYECCLCNACAQNCETGYIPADFIRESRSWLLAEGLAPEPVMDAIGAVLKDGNFYSVPASQTLNWLPQDEGGGSVLVYIGAAAAVKEQDTARALLSLLTKAGVPYSVFRENISTGSAEYDLMGNVKEVRDIAKVCMEALNAYGADTIVVLNPSDARMLKQEYVAWGLEPKASVMTATAFVDKLVGEKRLSVEKREKTVTFHDPCRLARDLQETEPARNILAAMGFTIKEMWQSRELTKCCGGEVLSSYEPGFIPETARGRMDNAVGTGAEILVCACPCCEHNLKKAEGIPVEDLFVLLDRHTKAV